MRLDNSCIEQQAARIRNLDRLGLVLELRKSLTHRFIKWEERFIRI